MRAALPPSSGLLHLLNHPRAMWQVVVVDLVRHDQLLLQAQKSWVHLRSWGEVNSICIRDNGQVNFNPRT